MSLMKRLTHAVELPRRWRAGQVGSTPHDVVHRENKWSLLRYRRETRPRHATPLLLVPSIINPHYILDLLPHKSVAGFFVAQGFDVYCIHWGRPEPEDRYVTFEDVAVKTVDRAARRAIRLSGASQTHVLGYCLGGTFAAIHTALHPELARTLTLLAAPVDFRDDGMLRRWTTAETFDVRAMIDAFGLVPSGLMKVAFQTLRPTTKLARLVGMVDRLHDEAFLDGFFALERWSRDTASLPGAFYATLIEALYQRNELARGTLELAGRVVDLSKITAPLAVITFAHDDIAPVESCTPILTLARSAEPRPMPQPGSHVGGAVSSRALKGLWPEVARFLAEHDTGAHDPVTWVE